MSPAMIFQTQLVLGYVPWLLILAAYGWPWLRSMDHIEAHRADPPRRAPLQEEPGGANDFSLLTAIHGSRRAAEIAAGSLAHFDDDQDAVVEAHQIKFPAPTAQVALEHGETSRL